MSAAALQAAPAVAAEPLVPEWRPLLVVRLALADLRHDAGFMASLVIGIAAVIAPLLLILGLKFGLVEFQRQRLVQDPVYREMRPVQTREFDVAFFAALRARPDVAFVVPGTLRSASSVRVSRPGGPDLPLDLLPTAPGDPLLLDNGAPVPGEAQAVLTQLAAERLGVAVGQTVTLVASRTLRGQNETVRLDLAVTGFLEPRADPLQRIYVTLSLAEDIELWRERRKIPARGWEGTVPTPYASYDGVLLATIGPLPESEQLRLQSGTGFGPPERLDAQALLAFPRAGEPAAGLALYRLRPVAGAVQQDSLVTLANRTRPFAGTAIAMVGGLQATLLAPAAAPRELPVAAYSLAEDQAARLGLPPVPWGRSPAADNYDSIARVLLPEALGIPAGSGVTLRLTIPDATLDLPVQVATSIAGEVAVVPAELPGLVRTAVDRRVSMDPDLRMPVLDPPGHRGFRLYARRLDDVPVLHRYFVEREIEVDAKLGDIQRVQALDRGLTRLFWLVAAVGIVGGIACLMASLHGAVQRKRRDFGMLRLLGLPRRDLLAFPLAQAAVIAWLAFGLAVAGFFGFAWIINAVFAADLPVGRQLCLLPAQHLLVAGLLTTAMAQVSAIWAAFSVTEIDPAEAIRVE